MEKIFLIVLMLCFTSNLCADEPAMSSEDQESESSEWIPLPWPADWVPHPHCPGTQPKDPNEPDMA